MHYPESPKVSVCVCVGTTHSLPENNYLQYGLYRHDYSVHFSGLKIDHLELWTFHK